MQAYLRPVTETGLLILLSCSDPASRTVAPHGGTAPRFSPNPLAAGIPTDGDPILIDISTSSTSNGLCNRLAAGGERLPGFERLDGPAQQQQVGGAGCGHRIGRPDDPAVLQSCGDAVEPDEDHVAERPERKPRQGGDVRAQPVVAAAAQDDWHGQAGHDERDPDRRVAKDDRVE